VTRRRLLLLAASVAAVVLAAGAGVFAWMWFDTSSTRKLGSATVEFIPREEPGLGHIPKGREKDETIPWTTYGFDEERTHFGAGMDVRPPFRQLWVTGAGNLISSRPLSRTTASTSLRSRDGSFHERGDGQDRLGRLQVQPPRRRSRGSYQTLIPAPCNYGP
jgi:hypothetical protein